MGCTKGPQDAGTAFKLQAWLKKSLENAANQESLILKRLKLQGGISKSSLMSTDCQEFFPVLRSTSQSR